MPTSSKPHTNLQAKCLQEVDKESLIAPDIRYIEPKVLKDRFHAFLASTYFLLQQEWCIV